jgi:hydroxyethylthiazole kinase-like uncharacterized protein yjeF
MTELLTTAEMAEADRLAIAGGTPGIDLMENAGRAVADCVAARHAPGTAVHVVAGRGNNGGDGYVAARLLQQRGYPVRVLSVGGPAALAGDAAQAAQRWEGPVAEASPAALAGAAVIIDALFGAGLSRDVEGPAREVIAAINAAGASVYAVDLPSGINGTTGAVMGVAVRATATVTFFRRKPGHVLLPGRVRCGPVALVDIGIPATVLDTIGPLAFVNDPSLWRHAFPVPRPDGHKYARGHAVVVSGDLSSTGAARLSARGALRAGAGLVTIASPPDALAVNAAASLAVMVRAVDGAEQLRDFLGDPRRNVVIVGPGGGVGLPMRELVRAAMAGDRSVVLDADALTSFAGNLWALVSAMRGQSGGTTVLTPHDGEFARLFKELPAVSNADSKLAKARLAAEHTDAVVILKGPDTVVAAPDGRAAIAENAPPWLATAGSGDVLAGFVGGLLAQGMPGFEAACAAVWLHGACAAEFGPGLIAEDLSEMVPRVYRRLFADQGFMP